MAARTIDANDWEVPDFHCRLGFFVNLIFSFEKNSLAYHFWQEGAQNLREGAAPLLPCSGRTLNI